MSETRTTDSDIQSSFLRALDQIVRTQDAHTKLLEQIVGVLTTEPQSNGILDAIRTLSTNVESQTGAIKTQTMEIVVLRGAMSRIAKELDGVGTETRAQSSLQRSP